MNRLSDVTNTTNRFRIVAMTLVPIPRCLVRLPRQPRHLCAFSQILVLDQCGLLVAGYNATMVVV